MDDYNLMSLIESKNEWSARLLNILTPCIIDGITSIFNESIKLCESTNEKNKYLMTFQNLLNNIPKWSSNIVEEEKNRIIETSYCDYLEDLITCIHIVQLKALSTARVGLKQKKINIDIPNINTFIHKLYVNVARKLYVNIYLFEKNISPLNIQKNNRELEILIKENILNTIRDSVPIDNILKAYLDETQETDVEVEEKIENIEKEIKKDDDIDNENELNKIKSEIKKEIKQEIDNKSNIKDVLKNINKNINEDLLDESKNDLHEINMDTLNGGNEISNKNSVNFEELDLDNLLLDKKEDKLSNLNNNIDNNDNIINDINIDNDIISINTNIDKSNESKINASPDLDLDLDLDIEELH
tara:strand:+ start:182 stop:1255 length:1074 start_codon:yes stop_codon:yes gene_type:complete